MSLQDAFGGMGSWLGSQYGMQLTEGEKRKILENYEAQYGDAGKLDPSSLGKTAFDGISTDPKTRAAQMEALASFQGLANQQGLDPQAHAMLAEANHEAAGFEQSQRQAMQQNMAARGMSGSGAEVAGLAAAEQGGANRSSMSANSAAADARNRAMLATQQQGQLSGAIRGQDYGEAGDKARAEDQARMNAWNGGLQKYGAVKDARQGLTNYYAADRAEQIGNQAAAGKGLGADVGATADIGASYMTQGAYQGGSGGGGKGDASSLKNNPYGSWGGGY